MHRSKAIPWVRRTLRRVVRKGAPGIGPAAGQDDQAVTQRLADVERRLAHLEAMVEGLQDAMHRESVRQGKQIEQLLKKAEPAAIRRALGRDAREHGL